MTEFQDIKIVELNDDASGAAVGPLTTMVLQLSADAPEAWSDTFNETWKGGASVMRRAATASGNTITSACMPYELQGQITELNTVVAATNAAHRDADQTGDGSTGRRTQAFEGHSELRLG